MLECNRIIQKKVTAFTRFALLLLPLACTVLLLSQTVFAKNTYMIDDGGKVTFYTTYATDPAEVLDEAGLKLNAEDTYVTQPGVGVSKITVQRIQQIRIVYGGQTLSVTSYGESVESLLNRLQFRLTDEDVVSVPLSDQTSDGLTVVIIRNTTKEETYTQAIPYNTTYCYDPTIPQGEETVLIEGAEGLLSCVVTIRYVDGVEVSRIEINRTVVKQPVDALISIGTYVEPVPDPIPQPEPEPEPEPEPVPEPTPEPEKPAVGTGEYIIGDGVIITPTGEKLTYSRRETFVATAYCREEVGGQITALGTPTRVGAIAVDPKVIPYGTKMFIRSQDGKYIYGVAVAEDCGGSIKGNRIDLFYETMPECVQFGIRDCDVFFLN